MGHQNVRSEFCIVLLYTSAGTMLVRILFVVTYCWNVWRWASGNLSMAFHVGNPRLVATKSQEMKVLKLAIHHWSISFSVKSAFSPSFPPWFSSKIPVVSPGVSSYFQSVKGKALSKHCRSRESSMGKTRWGLNHHRGFQWDTNKNIWFSLGFQRIFCCNMFLRFHGLATFFSQATSPEFWRCLGLVHWCIIAFPQFGVNHPFF